MRILVTGITGGIGSRLAPELLNAGHEVRALTRGSDASQPWEVPSGVQLALGDAVSGEGLRKALSKIDVAYYLIHSMEPGGDERFPVREHRAAQNFADAAVRARVGRIVYLGGLMPHGPVQTPPSEHLVSRLTVERTLLRAVPDSVALRASIVIGARSRSFRFLVRLVERLPILLVPAWGEYRTAPVDERDVLSCLVKAATAAEVAGRSLDIAGPDTVTYAELIDRIREQLLVARTQIQLHRLMLTPIASRLAAVVAGEQHAVIGPLMESLTSDLLPRPDLATDLLDVRTHGLDAAIARALRDWESTEPLRAH